jgi:hypothetical protein
MKAQKTSLIPMVLIAGSMFLLSACADVQADLQPCLEGHEYGFWGGLWHGLIAPFAFIGSLFSDEIAVWAVHNNGGWYTFGFVLGASILGGGGGSAARI